MEISVRPMNSQDPGKIVDYFIGAPTDYLKAMGADPARLPDKKAWVNSLKKELTRPYEEKENYYVIWLYREHEVGHSNINRIKFGEEGFMHLHLWKPESRQRGLARVLVRQTIPHFFQKFQLKRLICEPYYLNTAPTKTLLSSGFEFDSVYETIPGILSFQQKVTRYLLTRERWETL